MNVLPVTWMRRFESSAGSRLPAGKAALPLVLLALLLGAVLTGSDGFAQSESTPARSRIEFDIPAQRLDSALVVFSIQADTNVMGLSSTLAQFDAPAVRGTMTVDDALDLLLSGTGLVYRYSGERSLTVVAAEVPSEPVEEQPMDVGGESVADIDNEALLDEVVVTANRRAADLQKTAIAVTALQAGDLDVNQVRDLRDITGLVPGLEMIDTAPQAAVLVQLRGVGTTNITEIADGPVAIHVDGVYSPRSQAVAALLHDIERVEILRGPQGTLYGRNSSSGSINVYNRQPEPGKLSADLHLTMGNFDHRLLKGVFNLPVGETFSLRVAGAVNQHDGYTRLLGDYAGLGIQYPANSDDLTDYDRALDKGQQRPETADQSSIRVSGLWQPSDRVDALLSYERYEDTGAGIAVLDPTLVDQGIRGVVLDSPTSLDLVNDSLRSTLTFRLPGEHKLAYVFGWSDMSRRQIVDIDNGRDGSFEQQRTDSSRFRFASHELNLTNSDASRLSWVAGLFASREKNSIVFAVDQQNAGGGRTPVGATSWISDHGGAAVSYAIQPDRRVESIAAFAQSTFELTPAQQLTLGVRYTEDTKSDRGGRALNCRVTSVLGPYLEAGSVGPGAPGPEQVFADPAASAAIAAGLPFDGGTNEGIGTEPCWVRQVNDFSRTWNDTSGLARYSLNLGDDVMVYGSVSSGFKSGHIQDAGNNARPETVVSYELGFKSQYLNDSLRFNAALFRAEYDDLQFSGQDRQDLNGDGIPDTGSSTVVRNASKATIDGLELEMQLGLSDADTLQLVAALTDGRFQKFEIPDSVFGNLFNPFVDPASTSPLDPVDLSGNQPPRVPDWRLTLAYQHDFALPGGTLTPRVLATASDDYFLDIYNRDTVAAGVFDNLPNGGNKLGVQEAYTSLDFSLRYRPNSENWVLEAFVKNATDEAIKIASGDFITENGFVATYMPPRTYGVSVSYSTGR